jgi:myo-inositol-1-phosphate synthase
MSKRSAPASTSAGSPAKKAKTAATTHTGVRPDFKLVVKGPDTVYSDGEITSQFVYGKNLVEVVDKVVTVVPQQHKYTFKTKTTVPKHGMMLIGWGGNNGSTVSAALFANKHKMSWERKEGTVHANYFGSVTQASTVRLGSSADGKDVHVPFS